MQRITFLPITPSAWVRPTEVVVLPSPSGVGVMAVTSMYLPSGLLARVSRIPNFTLALTSPYGSRNSGGMPAAAAISVIGLGVAAREISMSEGTALPDFASLMFVSPFLRLRLRNTGMLPGSACPAAYNTFCNCDRMLSIICACLAIAGDGVKESGPYDSTAPSSRSSSYGT